MELWLLAMILCQAASFMFQEKDEYFFVETIFWVAETYIVLDLFLMWSQTVASCMFFFHFSSASRKLFLRLLC